MKLIGKQSETKNFFLLKKFVMSKKSDIVLQKRVIRTPFNYVQEAGEDNSGELLTMPDMAMSVQEIMHRFRTGRSVPESSDLQYHGDNFLPDVRKLDLVEQAELLEAARERVVKLEAEIADKQKLRSEALKARKEKLNRLLEGGEKEDVTISDKKDMTKEA